MKRKTMQKKTLSILIMTAFLLAITMTASPVMAADPGEVFINEIHYDNSGTDTGEAVEIAGPVGTDLTGWSLALYNGNGGALYATIVLTGVIPDQQNGYGTLSFAAVGLQNGEPDGLALVDPGGNVIQFLSYEGSFLAVGGPADGLTSTDIGVSEAYNSPVGYSLQLAGTGAVYTDFTWTTAQAETFGEINTGQIFGEIALPFVNEIHYDNDGTDTGEAIEIAGPAGTDLTGWSLVLYNGSGGAPYATIALIGVLPDQQNGYGTLSFGALGLQNGSPDGLALVDPGGNVIQFLSYEGSFLAVGGPVDGLTSTDIGVSEANNSPVGYSLQLTGTGTTYEDFTWATSAPHTFGLINAGQSFGSTPTYTHIYDIQYTTDPSGDSPYNGQTVTTQGIVTAFFYAGGNRYTFIQEGVGPWSGLILYRPEGFVNVGDLVTVNGTVSEYNGLTQIAYGIVTVQNSNNVLPAPESLPSGEISQEQWESVFVQAALSQVTDSDLGYGEWLVDNCGGGVRVDDLGNYTYLPTEGDLLEYVQGPLYYSFGDFKIVPRGDDDIQLGTTFAATYEIQGDGFDSPLTDAWVTTEGIVTSDFQAYGLLGGFNIQDPTGDGDPKTSDGLYIYNYSNDVNIGDYVRVRGQVKEYYNLTEVSNVGRVVVCTTGNSITPTPLELPVASIDDFEPYEGMLVTFPQALVISEYFNFDRFGEIVLTTRRFTTPTAEFEPGPAAIEAAADFLLSKITLDDGRTSQNPDPAIHPNGSIFNMTNLFRGGDTVANVTGVLDYSFGLYRIQPTQGANYSNANPRSSQPNDVGGGLKVASFNVLNYFTTLGSRGANDALEFERQRDKIFAALAAIDADVVGLIEIENNGAALLDLVTGLNELVGADTYAPIVTGPIGTDEITVAFIYKPATVSLVGSYAVLDDPSFTDPLEYGEQKSRPALAQSFMRKNAGGIFTAVVNHLKSKGSACNTDTITWDDDPIQGNCNLTRTLGAQALLNWLATDPTGSGDQDFLIIGDLNAYDKEDPIDAILASGYTDLIDDYLGEYAYSYVFDGQTGYLDHALANMGLLDEVTGTTIWHINADEPDLIDYDMTYKQDPQDALYAPDPYRSSDHDPVLVGLDLCDDVTPPTGEATATPNELWPVNHKYVTVEVAVTATDNFDPAPTITLVSVTSNEPDNGLGDGDKENDIVIVDDFTFKLRAERAGTGTDRIYTITYQITDACGNTTLVSTEVRVPHNR